MNNKKDMIIFMNCHGHEIYEYLLKIPEIYHNYNIRYICSYVNLNNEHVINGIINDINSCDILITNVLKNYDRLNFENIIKNVKESCKIIKIEFFRFNGFFPYKYIKCNNLLDCYDINYNVDNYYDYKNKISLMEKEIIDNFNECLIKLKELDDNSDIKIYDFFINNYKTKLLFRDYYHPTKFIFNEIIKQILLKLDIFSSINIDDINFNYTFGIDVRYKIINNNVKTILNIDYPEEKIQFFNTLITEKEYFDFTKQIQNNCVSDFNSLRKLFVEFINNKK